MIQVLLHLMTEGPVSAVDPFHFGQFGAVWPWFRLFGRAARGGSATGGN